VTHLLEVARRSLLSYWRALLVWTVALALAGLALTLFWPSVRDATGLEQLLENLPEAFRAMIGDVDLFTPEGFLASRLNSVFPLLITVYAAFRVASETAAEEQRGGFELLLGTQLPRTTLLLGRFLAVCIAVLTLMAATALGLIGGAAVVAMEISYANILAATAGLALLGIAFAGLALAVAGLSGHRGLTLGAGAGLAVTAFFVYSLTPLVPELAWLRPFTLFDRAIEDNPLAHGFATGDALVLVAFTAVMVAVAVLGFRRRDLRGA
jgi:ABC-2 type transport system permease protein